jgi:signal transduction histidine kinase
MMGVGAGGAAAGPAMTDGNGPTMGQPKTEPESPGRRVLWGVRARILVWYIALLSVAILASVLVVRRVLVVGIDERIDDGLVQEADELRKLAGGLDPETGEPFGADVGRIFRVFLQRNIPVQNEAYLAFVDGELVSRSRRAAPYRLDQQPDLMDRWANLEETERSRLDTPVGDLDYLAVPFRSGGEVQGVFVIAFFRDLELAEIDPAVRAAIAVGAVTLLIGSLLAWRVAEGVLRPVRLVTGTARSITETDLSQRIAVKGRDEVSTLAETFNQMLDRLEEAFAAQRRFVDDAGHELRTPITVIRGHLELLDEDPRERRKSLALVTDELDRMSRIVNDLLVLAKAQQPDFLALDTVDIDTLVREVHSKAQTLGPRRWVVEQTGRGRIEADRQRLTQAMMQLAQNAAEHTEEGGVITLGSALANGQARLWVRDDGPGVAALDRDRIFRRFSRGGARASEGAGLGLAIVRAIAEAHHGRIELDSRPGEGAQFTLVLPADQPLPEDPSR